jgi:chromate reductase
MNASTYTILGISGSIRPGASSALVLKWLGRQIGSTSHFELFDALNQITPFDGAENLPAAVEYFIEKIRNADIIIFCSPEYAHGISGVLKNALDWTVASDVWINKPVVVITAAAQGEHAHASLLEILSTMSASVVTEASRLIPFIKAKMNPSGEVTDEATKQSLLRSIETIHLFMQ